MPGLWTMQGFGQPQYTNVVMPFPDLPPHVPEENETGIYRRSFTIPRGWRSRPVVLHFGGAEGVLYVLVNGEPVGIAKDSRTPAEFDVSRPRAPRRAERARRRRRALVGCELRRGPGPVVARRPAALDPPGLADACATSRCAPAATDGSPCSRTEGDAPRSSTRAAGSVAKGTLQDGRLDGAGSRAAAVVGRGARALHARAQRRRRDRLVPRRLPARSRSATGSCSSTASRC